MFNCYRFFIAISFTLFITACGGGDSTDPTDTVQASITVSNLPTQVTINKTDSPDGRVEYIWGVTFDINNDGIVNMGDIVLRILHFKSPGSTEATVNVDSLPADLWLYTTDTETQSQFPVDMYISGNTINFSIERTAMAALETIDISTQVYFRTSYYDSVSGLNVEDYHPASRTYVAIPADGMFSDPAADVGFDLVDMVDMDIML